MQAPIADRADGPSVSWASFAAAVHTASKSDAASANNPRACRQRCELNSKQHATNVIRTWYKSPRRLRAFKYCGYNLNARWQSARASSQRCCLARAAARFVSSTARNRCPQIDSSGLFSMDFAPALVHIYTITAFSPIRQPTTVGLVTVALVSQRRENRPRKLVQVCSPRRTIRIGFFRCDVITSLELRVSPTLALSRCSSQSNHCCCSRDITLHREFRNIIHVAHPQMTST